MRHGLALKVENTTHGSGWFSLDPFYGHNLNRTLIPPTAVGGYFKSSRRKDLNNPPTPVGRILMPMCKFRVESI
jgi:hypothetical protein